MSSISFDRAADYYDQTRGYPPDVQERVGRALLDAAGATPASRILELGVGTGRIALPIIRAGYAYTGIDLSPRMLERLRAALREVPGAAERVTLVEGDITALPFADHSFDVVLTVHVYHLVSDPVQAIAEGVRVLDRPGVVLNGRDDVDNADNHALYEAWRGFLREEGWESPARRGAEAGTFVQQEWWRLGGVVDEIVGPEWDEPGAPAQEIDGLEKRLWSHTWAIPDEIHAAAISRLRAWATQHFGARVDTAVPWRHRFIIERARFS